MTTLIALLLFVAGCFIGLRFPDFDQTFRWSPLLVHRSLLTHSFLLPVLLLCALGAGKKGAAIAPRWLVMGVLLATAIHLCFDLYVRSWRGYALIHLPFYGHTTAAFSIACLVISAFVCLLLACRLLRNGSEFYIGMAGLIVCYGVSAVRQPSLSFWALVTLTILSCLAFGIARPKYDATAEALLER